MLIRRLGSNVYDVFGHNGFDHWTRVRRFLWGVKQVAGERVDHATRRSIMDALAKYPNGCLDNIPINNVVRLPDGEQVD